MVNNFGNFLEFFHTNFDSFRPRYYKIIAILISLDEKKMLSEHYQTERKVVRQKCFK